MTANVQSIFSTLEDIRRLADNREMSDQAASAGASKSAPRSRAVDLKMEPTAAPARSSPMNPEVAGSIQLVHDVASRFREMHQNARSVADKARQVVQDARSQIDSAEERARKALEAADNLMDRLERTEDTVRELKERVRQSEQRAEEAEKLLGEFEGCLRKTFEALSGEFDLSRDIANLAPAPAAATKAERWR